MEAQVIVSAVGKDRPGIVHNVSKLIHSHGGNITVQRSVKLGGDFAIILMFTVDVTDDAARDAIVDEIAALSDDKLQVSAHPATSEQETAEPVCELTVTGADQPGIINTLTLFLLEHGANIHAMDYTVASGPFTAAPIFTATATLSLTSDRSLRDLREGLNQLESDLNIDVELADQKKTADA